MTRPDRQTRMAGCLKVDDYVHDELVSMRVVDFEPSWPGTVRVVGRIQSGTEMRATHPCRRKLDVTRLVD